MDSLICFLENVQKHSLFILSSDNLSCTTLMKEGVVFSLDFK